MAETEAEAAGFVFNAAMNAWLSPALGTVVRLKIPDLLVEGALPAAELALSARVHERSLRRVLDALSAAGVFTYRAGRYGLAPISTLLRSDHPLGLGALIDVSFGGENQAAWTAFETAVRTGDCAFELCHGVGWIEYLAAHEDRRAVFANAMTATSRAADQAILDARDFAEFRQAVDVGGSAGAMIGGWLMRHRQARGIVFDLPETIRSTEPARLAAPYADRLSAVGGDFFRSLPEGDLYFLKLVLHDWEDEDALAILRTIRRAIRPEGRVAVIETILPDDRSPHPGWGLDVVMMALTGGRERTLAEHRRLLEAAGFAFVGMTPTGAPYSIVEARPAG